MRIGPISFKAHVSFHLWYKNPTKPIIAISLPNGWVYCSYKDPKWFGPLRWRLRELTCKWLGHKWVPYVRYLEPGNYMPAGKICTRCDTRMKA